MVIVFSIYSEKFLRKSFLIRITSNIVYLKSCQFCFQYPKIFWSDSQILCQTFDFDSYSSILIIPIDHAYFSIELGFVNQTFDSARTPFRIQCFQNNVGLVLSVIGFHKSNEIFSCHFSWPVVKHEHFKLIQNIPIVSGELDGITPCDQDWRSRLETSAILPISSSQADTGFAHHSHDNMIRVLFSRGIKESLDKERDSGCMGYRTLFKVLVHMNLLCCQCIPYDSQTHDSSEIF